MKSMEQTREANSLLSTAETDPGYNEPRKVPDVEAAVMVKIHMRMTQ